MLASKVPVPCLLYCLSLVAPRCLLCGVRISVSMKGVLPAFPKWLSVWDTEEAAEQEYTNADDNLVYTQKAKEQWPSMTWRQNNPYDQEKECFEEIGAPLGAYQDYFLCTFGMLIFPWASAASARLLVGDGYWATLWDTWNDRHLHTFLNYLVNASLDGMGEVAEATTGTAQGALIMAQRWLVVLNHFIWGRQHCVRPRHPRTTPHKIDDWHSKCETGDGASFLRGVESMVMKFQGNVQGEVRVNFLALFASNETPHFHLRCPQIVWSCSPERSLEHCHSHTFLVPNFHPATRGVQQKESGKKVTERWRKRQKKWSKSDRKQKRVVELLLLTSFCHTLIFFAVL